MAVGFVLVTVVVQANLMEDDPLMKTNAVATLKKFDNMART